MNCRCVDPRDLTILHPGVSWLPRGFVERYGSDIVRKINSGILGGDQMFAPGTEVLDTRTAERVVIERQLEGGEYLARRVSDDERVRVAAGGLQSIGGGGVHRDVVTKERQSDPATEGGEPLPPIDGETEEAGGDAAEDGDSGDEPVDEAEESGDAPAEGDEDAERDRQ